MEENISALSKSDDELSCIDNFDWKTYTQFYDDLKHITSESEAINHWVTNGKTENRIFFSINDTKDILLFDWEKYKNFYDDLKCITEKKNVIYHWLKYGKKEKRHFFKINTLSKEDEYNDFDWKTYIQNYEDLTHICCKNDAWLHWINYGKKEKRVLHNLHDIEVGDYLKIKEEEKKILITSNKSIIFKPLYSNYGLHYFGWKGVMNHFMNFIQKNHFLQDFCCNQKIFFDEWIEKLFIWGNKIQSAEFVQKIEKNNYMLITFLHNPPYEKYKYLSMEEKEKINTTVLFNEDLLNSYLFRLLKTKYMKMKERIVYLYTLSNSHKEYIYLNYPEYRNSLVSIYHPIKMRRNEKNNFQYELFVNHPRIFHIGWWLRNFKTFIDLHLSKEFQKNILVKKDFEKQWLTISKNFDIQNIQIVYELENDEYEKIFKNSCLFLHLEDTVANNVILECIRFNTPIIVNKLDSIVEYLGQDYPFYFSNTDELKEIESYTNAEMLSRVLRSHIYLQNMDKTHLQMVTFNKKIQYDLQKLCVTKNQERRLTWFFFIENVNEIHYIPKIIEQFRKQESFKNILLHIFINEELEKEDSSFFEDGVLNDDKMCKTTVTLRELLLDHFSLKMRKGIKETTENISFLFINQEQYKNDYLQICLDHLMTDYFVIMCIYSDIETTFSSIFINYLDKNPTCDIGFSSFKILDSESEDVFLYEKNKYLFYNDLKNPMDYENLLFVFRKNICILINSSFRFTNQNILFIKTCMKHNLNFCCVSNNVLYTIL